MTNGFLQQGELSATIAGVHHRKSQKGNSISLRCHQNSVVMSVSLCFPDPYDPGVYLQNQHCLLILIIVYFAKAWV